MLRILHSILFVNVFWRRRSDMSNLTLTLLFFQILWGSIFYESGFLIVLVWILKKRRKRGMQKSIWRYFRFLSYIVGWGGRTQILYKQTDRYTSKYRNPFLKYIEDLLTIGPTKNRRAHRIVILTGCLCSLF